MQRTVTEIDAWHWDRGSEAKLTHFCTLVLIHFNGCRWVNFLDCFSSSVKWDLRDLSCQVVLGMKQSNSLALPGPRLVFSKRQSPSPSELTGGYAAHRGSRLTKTPPLQAAAGFLCESIVRLVRRTDKKQNLLLIP